MPKHNIEIDIPASQTSIIPFINHTVTIASEYGVTIHLENKKLVKMCRDCETAHGLFSDIPKPTLRVACDNPFDHWFTTLLHESSHMDQWIEGIDLWDEGYVMGIDANDILDLWMHHKIELTDTQRMDVLRRVRDIEVDCEKRAVDKIKKFNLPVNITQYIQKANAYAYYYTVLGITRKWPEGPEAYEIDSIWTNMPTEFSDDYTSLTPKVRDAFKTVVSDL